MGMIGGAIIYLVSRKILDCSVVACLSNTGACKGYGFNFCRNLFKEIVHFLGFEQKYDPL